MHADDEAATPSNVNPRRPNVTGLSPKEGTPGTQVTIRGENLGTGQGDMLSVIICGVECVISARWESPHKIVARVGRARGGSGEVLVTTKSGGRGVCAVSFRVYHVQIGALHESAVWVDESRTVPGREASAAAAAASIANDQPLQIPIRANRRMPLPQLQAMFPDGGGNLKMENFYPAWYMLEHHRGATVDELREGVRQLAAHSAQASEAPRDIIKSNIAAFMACVDSLQSAQAVLNDARQKGQWPLTTRMEQLTKESHEKSIDLFSNVLTRKDKADATRNALSVLTRFQFLFYLPHSIDKRVQANEYGAILSDYTRARSLFGDTDQPLFREALAEVEKRMDAFKQTLLQRLLEAPSTLEQQRKTIKYLLMLEPDSDPGLDCLQAQHQWLEAQLWQLQDKHYKQARSRQLSHVHDESTSSSDADAPTINQLAAGATASAGNVSGGELPERYEFVEAVLMLLAGRLRDVQQLATAYVDGTLSAHNNLHRQGEIESLLAGTVTLASWLMLNALLPDHVPTAVLDQYGERLVRWPKHHHDTSTTHELGNALRILRNQRACIAQLRAQNCAAHVLRALAELTVTLRIEIVKLCTNVTVARVLELETKETWRVQATEAVYTRTQLPAMFESIVSEVLPLLRQVVVGAHFVGEADLGAATDEVDECTLRLLVSFTHTLFALVRLQQPTNSDGAPHRPDSLPIQSDTDASQQQQQQQQIVLVKDRKVLITLANCDYALQYSLVTLCERVRENGIVSQLDALLERAREHYTQLHASLLKAYTNVKCRPAAVLIEERREWLRQQKSECPFDEMLAVSNYIKELLLFVVGVHAELFLHARHFSQQVMTAVVAACARQLIDLLTDMPIHGGSSPCQCRLQSLLDITAFELAVSGYLVQPERQQLRELQARLHPHKSTNDDNRVLKACQKFRVSMRLTLLSLSNLSGGTTDV